MAMKCRALVLVFTAALFVTPVASASTGSPVEKVVELLKDLQAKVTQDGKAEENAYNKYACWCDKTSERKATAIEQAEDQLRALGQQILKLKGKIATLTAEIEELAQKIKENLEAQDEATALRSKENGEFQASSAELKDALAAMEKAVDVLIKGSSLLQVGSGASAGKAALRSVLQKLPKKTTLAPETASRLSEFLQTSTQFQPQSMTIQGILKDMYDTFGSDLEAETRAEAKANRQFELFIEVKQRELAKMREEKANKEEQKASAEELLAETTQEYDDTEAQMKADIEFFDATKAACEAKHKEWEVRDGLRQEEIEGISKAVGILTTDEAREMFGKAIKPGKETGTKAKFDSGVDIADSFLQVDAFGSMSAPVARAFASLKAHAGKAHSLRLAALAVQIRESKAGHFDKVIDSINAMIQMLQDEGAADIAKRDQCKDEYKKTASVIANVNWLIKVNDASIDKLEKLIDKRTEEKKQTIEDIKEVERQIDAMEAQRKAENEVFLQAKSDDAAAIDLLKQARTVLSKYYKTNKIDMGDIQGSVKGALVQQPEFAISKDQAPDFEFSKTGSRKGMSKGIVSIMTMLIEDLNDEIKNGMKDEANSQEEFEKSLKAAKDLKTTLEEKKVNLEDAIAARTEEKDEENRKKTNNGDDLQDEVDYKKSITPDCDWILGAFTGRAERRTAEMNGLTEAKSYLAGAAVPSGFLQKSKGPTFDDAAFSEIRFLGVNSHI